MGQLNEKVKELRKQALALPLRPGVYLMKDAKGKVIYVGKAKALKNRVSQYFGPRPELTGYDDKVLKMVGQVERFDYIVTDSEFEALVLECSLIKQYDPYFNVKLRDAKGYHYIRITPPPYGRISMTRTLPRKPDGARYIGPYVSNFTVTDAIDEVNRVFQLPTCRKTFAPGKKERPCLNHYIGRCCAPCSGRIDEGAYEERMEQAVEFLTRGGTYMLETLREQMEKAAENLQFEKAARLRDRMASISKLSETQKVVMARIGEQDIVALAQGEEHIAYEVFRFREGRLADREDFVISTADLLDVEESGENGAAAGEGEDGNAPQKGDAAGAESQGEAAGSGEAGRQRLDAARAAFLRRYYTLRDDVPRQVTLDGPADDRELLEAWLSDKAGRRVRIVQPQKGEQAKLVGMCRDNAAERLARELGLTGGRFSGRDAAALDELARLLGLASPPMYIESYDISHTGGSDTVAGMVVFENGRPLKHAYKRFIVRESAGDDYAAMREIVGRRLNEYEKHRAMGKSDGFGRLPDLILLDGGRGQVAAVLPVVEAAGLNIPVYGMVKDDKHRTRAIAENGGEIAIGAQRTAFALVTSIQDEVHRWAITYHRQKRRQQGIGTVLTEIEGIGESRAKALLRRFGSIKAVREAPVDDLASVKGMGRPAAERVYAYFHGSDGDAVDSGEDSIARNPEMPAAASEDGRDRAESYIDRTDGNG